MTAVATMFVTYSVRDKIETVLEYVFKRKNGNGRYVGKMIPAEMTELVRSAVSDSLRPVFDAQLNYLKQIADSTAQTKENTAVLLDRG